MITQQEQVQIGTLHEDVGAAGLRFDTATQNIVDSTNPIQEEAADLMPTRESKALTVNFETGRGSREEVTPLYAQVEGKQLSAGQPSDMLVDLSEDEFEEEVLFSEVEARLADPDLAARALDLLMKTEEPDEPMPSSVEGYTFEKQKTKDMRGGPVSEPRAGQSIKDFWEMCSLPRSIGGRRADEIPARYKSGTKSAAIVRTESPAAEPPARVGVEIPGDAEFSFRLQAQAIGDPLTEAPSSGGASSSSMLPPASSSASTSATTRPSTASATSGAAGSSGSAAVQPAVEGVAPQHAATSTATAPAASPTKRMHPFHVEFGDVQPPPKVPFLEPEKVEEVDKPAREPMQKGPELPQG